MKKLNGYKTYLVALFGVIYGWGIQKGLWPHEPTIDYLIGGGAIAAIRHGFKNEIAKAVTAILTDPPDLSPVTGVTATTTTPTPRTDGPGAAGKPILSILVGFCVLAGVIGLATGGCQSGKLESGGAYAPIVTNTVTGQVSTNSDMALFLIDSAYKTAWSAMDTAFTIETQNADLLWKVSPDIKHTLDAIRPQATAADAKFAAARTAYLAQPTPDNMDALHAVLMEIQKISSAAQAAIPQITTQGN